MGVYVVGDEISESLYVGATGLTFTRIASYINGDPVTWSPTFVEIGSGFYRWSRQSAIGDTAGSYEWAGTASDGTPVPINFDLNASAVVTTASVVTTSGSTRKQVRRDVLADLGDILILTATGDGTDVTLIDTDNLYGEVDAYRGREVRFTGGTAGNLGEIRYVTGSSASQRAIGWGVALPADTATGDEAELVNTRGLGFRSLDVDRTIARALRSLAGDSRALFPLEAETETFARGTGIAIPATFRTVEDVLWQEPDDEAIWHAIPKANRAEGQGWWVDRAERELKITGRPALRSDTMTVKIMGLGVPSEPNSDDDTIPVSHDWLVAATQALLARARHMRMATPENERLMYGLQQEAERKLRLAVHPRGPFSTEV